LENKIFYIEIRDGNANVKFEQASTLTRAYDLLKENGNELPRRKRTGYPGIYFIRCKRRGIYPKEIKNETLHCWKIKKM